MPGLAPGIHGFPVVGKKDFNGCDTKALTPVFRQSMRGHDEGKIQVDREPSKS